MADEPTDLTLGVSPSRGPWAPGGDPWSQSNNEMGNGTSGADGDQPFFHLDNIMSLLVVLVSLCGAAGNGAVVWLVRSCGKRFRFSIYFCILGCADGLFLLLNGIYYTVLLLRPELVGWGNPWAMFQLIRLGLLVADINCISCTRPIQDSCMFYYLLAVFPFIPGLAVCVGVSGLVCAVVDAPCVGLDWVYVVTVVVSLLLLCMSIRMLLHKVQCSFRVTRTRRLYTTMLLTFLAFLLLGLPYNVYVLVLTIAPDTEYVPGLWETLVLLSTLNSAVNPVIYFLMGRYRQQPDKTPPPTGALEGAEQGQRGAEKSGISSPQTPLRPLSSGESLT